MNMLVVPTIREDCIKEFLQAWRDTEPWDTIMVVEDNPHKTFSIDVDYHYSWEEIEAELGTDHWIISRRDSAVRCFGHYMAWKEGANYIFDLDDDCFPTQRAFAEAHIYAMDRQPRWIESIPGMRTRGLPYYNRGNMTNVVANMGLWNGIPDLDAVQTISGGSVGGYIAPKTSRIIPRGQYFPLCGMNFAFRREVAVLTYFPLMGENSPYRRFDDIWFGVIFKKICDHLNLSVACGTPIIEHRRASAPMVNLVKEAPGIQFNEEFWGVIDKFQFTSITPKSCMTEMGEYLPSNDNNYISNLGKAIIIWAGLFN